MEEELRSSEEKYRATFENTGTAMIIIEENTIISLVNREMERLVGYPREEIEGKKSWTEFVAPEDLPRMKEHHVRRRQNTKEVPRRYEFNLIDRRGVKKNIQINIDLIPGTGQSVASLVDITEYRRAEESLRKLSGKIIEAQEDERSRIARELHDGLGQMLNALKFDLSNMKNKMEKNQPVLIKDLSRAIKLVKEIMGNTRSLSRELIPPILEDTGLLSGVRWMAGEFGNRYGIQTALHMEEAVDESLPKETQLHIFRIIQEALANIAKHSQAQKAEVTIKTNENKLFVRVYDNGAGFDSAKAQKLSGGEKGMGLGTIEERARLIGGALTVKSKKGAGTEVFLDIPLQGGNQ